MGYLVKLPTYEFASKVADFTWQEVLTAVERKVVSRQFAIEHAMAKLAVMDEYPDALVELASLSKSDDIHPFIDELAEGEDSVSNVNEKLLFLVLSWLFETKDTYDDPLSVVEEIYADFDYPDSISGFIRYMPSDEPDLGSFEKNSARLIDKWKSFIDDQSEVYDLRKQV